MLAIAVKNRMAEQISQIICEGQSRFTTLFDINTFLVSFYEFIT